MSFQNHKMSEAHAELPELESPFLILSDSAPVFAGDGRFGSPKMFEVEHRIRRRSIDRRSCLIKLFKRKDFRRLSQQTRPHSDVDVGKQRYLSKRHALTSGEVRGRRPC
jgi:hypothetical protein